MATRKRRTSATRRRRTYRRNPMASVRTRQGKTVSRKRWRASGYRRNRPVRRRPSYRRNQPIFKELTSLGMQTVAALAGGAVGRRVSALVPFTDAPGGIPFIEWGKNALIAIGIKMGGRRYLKLSPEMANAAALGALLNPTRDLLTAAVPQVGGFLSGSMAMPSFPGTAMRSLAVPGGGLYSYSGNGMDAYAGEAYEDEGMSSYSEGW